MSAIRAFFGFGKKGEEREVPFDTLLKGTSIMVVAPFMLLAILVSYGKINVEVALYGISFIMVLSIIFVRPYIANLSSLIYYVKQLASDKKATAPDLSFLNNVEELSVAVEQLHISWENRQKKLEVALAESRILIDSLPDIIIMLDENLNVIKTNSTAKMIFGDKYIDQVITDFVEDEEISAYIQIVNEDGVSREADFYIPDPFFSHYIVRFERFPVYSEGGIAVIVVLHDITKQKETERMLSDFVANASHEIRTPLTSVIGFIETLQTVAKEDEEARETFLDIMSVQANRISNLVNGLLSLSQLERNLHTKPIGDVNVASILRDAQSNLLMYADEKDITINLHIKDKLPTIDGDSGELTQVFENLLSNAVKYGDDGSIVSIEASIVNNIYKDDVNLCDVEKVISIQFTDEGEGIDSKHIPRLTERFYCVDTARSRKVGGTGLGLSIVHYIIERHKGSLLIESEVGVGSSFTVILPVNR